MKRPIESDYTSQVAYTRALEAYCDTLSKPEQRSANEHLEPVVFNTLASLKHKKTVGPIESAMMNITPPQPKEQEPVGPEPFGYFQYDIRLDAWVQNRVNNKGVAFYTTSPQRKKD